MSQATTAILYAPGTNCHEETAAAIELAGGKAELVLLQDLIGGDSRLDDYQAAVVPGGFSYGDHLGAGRIFATMLVARLRDQLVRFLDAQEAFAGNLQWLPGPYRSGDSSRPHPRRTRHGAARKSIRAL